MNEHDRDANRQPFPLEMPPVCITPLDQPPFEVDLCETDWFVTPRVGRSGMWASYDRLDGRWRLSGVTAHRVTMPALVHDIPGVEIVGHEWEPETGWQREAWTAYHRITDEAIDWLGIVRVQNGARRVYTFLEDGFDDDFYGSPRKVRDAGRFARQTDGSYVRRGGDVQGRDVDGSHGAGPEDLLVAFREQSVAECGAGLWEVRIGDRQFTCLRMIEIGLPEEAPTLEHRLLLDRYVTESGRAVIARRYNGRLWKVREGGTWERPWDEQLPDNHRLTIDGAVFVLWYECLTDLGAGSVGWQL